MTGHRSFGNLIESFTAERWARVDAKAAAWREAIKLEKGGKLRSRPEELDRPDGGHETRKFHGRR
jgi:hypothetical protein